MTLFLPTLNLQQCFRQHASIYCSSLHGRFSSLLKKPTKQTHTSKIPQTHDLNIWRGKWLGLWNRTVFITQSNTNSFPYTFLLSINVCVLHVSSLLCQHFLKTFLLNKLWQNIIINLTDLLRKNMFAFFYNLSKNMGFAIWNYFSHEIMDGVLLKESARF